MESENCIEELSRGSEAWEELRLSSRDLSHEEGRKQLRRDLVEKLKQLAGTSDYARVYGFKGIVYDYVEFCRSAHNDLERAKREKGSDATYEGLISSLPLREKSEEETRLEEKIKRIDLWENRLIAPAILVGFFGGACLAGVIADNYSGSKALSYAASACGAVIGLLVSAVGITSGIFNPIKNHYEKKKSAEEHMRGNDFYQRVQEFIRNNEA